MAATTSDSPFNMASIYLPSITEIAGSHSSVLTQGRKRRIHSDWKSRVFAPGKYFIGDIGYVMSNKNFVQWNLQFGEGFFRIPDPSSGETTTFAVVATKSDEFTDNYNYHYEVSTGFLCILPWSLCTKKHVRALDDVPASLTEGLGRVLNVTEPITFEYCEGKIQITGNITSEMYLYIDTEAESDDEEDDDNDDSDTDSESTWVTDDEDDDNDASDYESA